MENKLCPQCGGKMYHNKGISKKNNKPYENWKCGTCKEIEWVDIIEPQNGNAILSDEILARLDKIEKRFDDMSAWISLNSKKWEK